MADVNHAPLPASSHRRLHPPRSSTVNMRCLRTPDHHFLHLHDYPFAPNYSFIDDGDGGRLRVHYVDEGPRDAGEVVLLMHGEPTWSYLYRKMIPILVRAGHRVVAPDLVGFGKSDKPSETRDYTYARHVNWMSQLIFSSLDLRRVTLFGQDWGGLIGLRLLAQQPQRFSRVVVSNTGLPTGDRPPPDAFMKWRSYSQNAKDFPVGTIISGGCASELSAAAAAAYDAPFPDDRRNPPPTPHAHAQQRTHLSPHAAAATKPVPAYSPHSSQYRPQTPPLPTTSRHGCSCGSCTRPLSAVSATVIPSPAAAPSRS